MLAGGEDGGGAGGGGGGCGGGAGGAEKARVRWDLVKTLAWVSVAAVAAGVIAAVEGRDRALEFVAGYVVEYSLSVDNLFVFLLVFRFFKVPREAQEAVLFWGILGAMLLRGVMIVLGKTLAARFAWVSAAFAALLLYSAAKLLLEDDDAEEDLENNRIVALVRRALPVHDRYHADRFFVFDDGKLYATPLAVVLVTIELSDVVFAMDSVPAVLGISRDPVVIYASNIFAVMGLRSLFFVISDAIANLRFLRQSLAVVLGFVGVKMLAALAGREFDVLYSLAFIVLALATGVAASLAFPAADARPPAFEDPESGLARLEQSTSAVSVSCAVPT